MKIHILGAGALGTLYAVRFARAGHEVTLIARGNRAAQLQEQGARIRDLLTGRSDLVRLPLIESIGPETQSDLCFIFVRREQIEEALPTLRAGQRVARFVCMFNHANGSQYLFDALGRHRVVLGFPGAAGGVEDGLDSYLELTEQATVIETEASEVGAILRQAGFRVAFVADMDSWLRRHAVFVTAVAGALYEADGNAVRLSFDPPLVQTMVLAVREGWAELDKRGAAPAPVALRAIFQWVPLPAAVLYWRRFMKSDRGEYYFARHVRRAAQEMAALAQDIRSLLAESPTPHLLKLYEAIDRAAGK